MVEGRSCRRGAVQLQERREQAQEPTMRRHIHVIPTAASQTGSCGIQGQLCELNQIMDYQNKILTELLAVVQQLNKQTQP